MDIRWWFEWWNAVYTLPLAFVVVFLAVTSLVGLLGGAFGELAHHDANLHAEADLPHDAHAGLDASPDHGPETHLPDAHDADGGAEHAGAHAGLMVSALLVLGAGHAPAMLLLQIFLLLWGLIGVGLHQALHAAGGLALAWSLPVTLAASVAGTRAFALLFGRYFRQHETSAQKRDQVVGRMGRVVFQVTPEEGTVHVRDSYGTLHRLRARAAEGRLEPGQEIIILGYDRDRQIYQVDDATTFVDRP